MGYLFNVFSLLCVSVLSLCRASEPNPPTWPASVEVFSPSDDAGKIMGKINAAFDINGGHTPANHGQFSDKRFAFLFKPGSYEVDAPVGFYTQIVGLGETPEEVIFTGEKGVYSEEGAFDISGALCSFWRSAENFRTSASFKWTTGTGMMWAVSQGAPTRRIVVDNDLVLFEYQPPITAAGEASGGFMANMKVGGSLKPGSQQQWFSRDSTIKTTENGVWNMVYTGVDGAPPKHCGNQGSGPNTVIPQTPVVSEKPYITIDTSGKYFLVVPPVKTNSHGADHIASGAKIDFSQVYVSDPRDTASILNAKLAAGLNVVLSPAIYDLDEPLRLNTEGQILLGLGLATLRPTKANVVVEVGDVAGVRVAGIIVQAGPLAEDIRSPALIQWGTNGTKFAGSATNPGFLQDIFARVGGPDGTPTSVVGVDAMIVVNAGHVIGDNMWLWRADHTVGGGTFPHSGNDCDHGLVVHGDDVTMYGLAVEHTLQDLTVWNGERGRTFFYQSELPYQVQQSEWGALGYAGYRVAPHVTQHEGHGIGVYCYFASHNVTTASGIICPARLEGSFHNSLSVKLNGQGGIEHVINDKGAPATGNTTAVVYVC